MNIRLDKAFTPRRLAIIGFTVLYACGFYLWFVLRGNTEFVLYFAEFFVFIALVCYGIKKVPTVPDSLLALISLVGLFHAAGGGVPVDGGVLYGYHLIPFFDHSAFDPDLYILKYDQVEHFFGFGVAALAFRWLLLHFKSSLSVFTRDIIAILAAVGLGALNEVSEFAAVLLFPSNHVGGYYNLALDLTFNVAGAIVAVLIISIISRVREKEVWV